MVCTTKIHRRSRFTRALCGQLLTRCCRATIALFSPMARCACIERYPEYLYGSCFSTCAIPEAPALQFVRQYILTSTLASEAHVHMLYSVHWASHSTLRRIQCTPASVMQFEYPSFICIYTLLQPMFTYSSAMINVLINTLHTT